ncbi:TetR/AcrR family transcriptional regulator [Mycobacterium paraterrae]|uniref:TetR/AcrR family transcriptional regulator n=1 Tax=Mycobacterium paraterrae TaxID=577492 RepID=A0ABY3VPN7_9MYCO|nr:TetR/AcrR family transcriptional regulator [Mycobacterium paraterrae]UMB69136.1 TetR/AcrR family transcriptional regulator [Mycobacterium paraterrae]
MTAVSDRPLRADAARNAERILRATRDVYDELGPEAPIEAIARRAGVGERTIYRRFPTKAELVRAALDQCVARDLTPTIDEVRDTADPLDGLARLIDAAISLGARERNLLIAAHKAGSLTSDVSTALVEVLTELAERGRHAGVIRSDLAAADLPRMITMLYSVLQTMDPGSDGWRRYVALMLDAISAGERRPLPPVAALRFGPESDSWPI